MRDITIDPEEHQRLMDDWVANTHYVEQADWKDEELPEDGDYPEDDPTELDV